MKIPSILRCPMALFLTFLNEELSNDEGRAFQAQGLLPLRTGNMTYE
jgi:hypothetical protein